MHAVRACLVGSSADHAALGRIAVAADHDRPAAQLRMPEYLDRGDELVQVHVQDPGPGRRPLIPGRPGPGRLIRGRPGLGRVIPGRPVLPWLILHSTWLPDPTLPGRPSHLRPSPAAPEPCHPGEDVSGSLHTARQAGPLGTIREERAYR